MEDFFAAVQGSAVADALKFSRWGYATANAAHILSIGLLIGAVVPMNLRLLGAWGQRSLTELARVLVPMAAFGLGCAILTGMTIFTVKAKHYASLELIWVKLTLVATGLVSAVVFHVVAGWWLQRSGPAQRRVHAVISLGCWIGALLCGRYVAYAR